MSTPTPHALTPIAYIRSDFPTKFGIPRQSGLVDTLRAAVIFTPPYRNEDALRGIRDFSHLWLIWHFSACTERGWSPTVRPPRLGGNRRVGVFASRSPFRPNSLGLSCVRLLSVESAPDLGTHLIVGGADLMDGTPIYDVKPYLPYADSHPEAAGGFADAVPRRLLTVDFPPHLLSRVPEERREALAGVLANDPRPSYQSDPDRIYGMAFAGVDVGFRVEGEVLHVVSVTRCCGLSEKPAE